MDKGQKSLFAAIEEEILTKWNKDKTFEKSVSNRKGGELFNFNDGPPFANGLPHFGHSLVTGIKDSILRYKTMRGYYVPRRNGWDCHGLPVEFSIEKELGVSGKKQILEIGLDKFNQACRDSIFRYKADWERFLKRYGRWSDYDNYYATVDTSYTESVWWVLSEINKKGLLYRGFKSLPYCPRCATPLSNFELNEGYKDNVPDPSVFAMFPLTENPTIKLLAWTTTPWTLPANAALAVDRSAEYVYAELKSDATTLILAKDRLDVLDLRKSDYKVVKTVSGDSLIGLRYLPLYELPSKTAPTEAKQAHQVFYDPSVSLEDGTGILHVAPRYGETDLALGLAEKLPLIESVDNTGHLIYGPQAAIGKFFKDADDDIIADLTKSGRIFAAETAEHTYPFCWRCDTPLMYFATTTWFVEVTKIKDQLLKTAEQINWTPENIKSGRFGQWLEGARDWAISRNRYWGAPMPIWINVEDDNDYLVVGSIKELEDLAGKEVLEKVLKKEDGVDLHRPFIDGISFKKDGKTYKRVEEVLDCWFESGSMPVAQWHYPFENKDQIQKRLMADFITEGLDQTRLWFYVQHVISTILFEQPAYKNVIVSGIIMAADGQKLSKRLKNYPPTEDVFDHEGADAWRLYLLSSTQATETADYMRFRRQAVTDIQRNVLGTLYNSYKFFDTYSKLDRWESEDRSRPAGQHLLDKWILARLDETVVRTTASADAYRIAHAIEPIVSFIDDLSNWYIRRSRRRFWKGENDTDKQHAYGVLHYCLITSCQLLAPFAPFLSDKIYSGLMDGSSVHLSDWPSANEPDIASLKLLEEMLQIREAIAEGLSQRAQAKIKVRQPLQSVSLGLEVNEPREYSQIVAEELNVKEVKWADKIGVQLDTSISSELREEGLAREVIRLLQTARKKAGFNVEDRIQLSLKTGSKELATAIGRFKELIYNETLATGELSSKPQYTEQAEVDGLELEIGLMRA